MTMLQLHLLSAMPPHNVNRDEDGRPKTTVLGGALRGRISSQAKKRALRFAPDFPASGRALRTREVGIETFLALRDAGVDEASAIRAAIAVNIALGAGDGATKIAKAKPDAASVKKLLDRAEKIASGNAADLDPEEAAAVREGLERGEARRAALLRLLRSSQGLVVGTREHAALKRKMRELATACASDAKAFTGTLEDWLGQIQRGLLSADEIDLDTALFGRMVAAAPTFNIEAAASVSHAVTTHAFAVEGDYFSAGEELNMLGETGAAITSYAFFGSGVYYQHAVLDVGLLRQNLLPGRAEENVPALVRRATELLLDGLVFAQPKGKRHAFAADVAAGYIIADIGPGPALNLATAFLDPIRPGPADLMVASIARLKEFHAALVEAYCLERHSLAFNAWPSARGGNAEPEGERWDYGVFKTALLDRLA
jgi:CRISPR system Cascade subunit CasC